tara:strand:- start:279 stop:419 length:141 start_codon:yes stop_codon:yes gene_type:complete
MLSFNTMILLAVILLLGITMGLGALLLMEWDEIHLVFGDDEDADEV